MKEQRTRASRAEKALERLTNGGGEEGKDGDEEDEHDFSDLPRIPSYQQRRLWGEHVNTLLLITLECQSQDLLVELVGTLGNFTGQDLNKGHKWEQLMKEHSLCVFLGRLLVPGMSQDDLILEVIVLLTTLCVSFTAASLIAGTTLVGSLADLWEDKGGDSEVAVQLMSAYHRMLHFEVRRCRYRRRRAKRGAKEELIMQCGAKRGGAFAGSSFLTASQTPFLSSRSRLGTSSFTPRVSWAAAPRRPPASTRMSGGWQSCASAS